MDTIESKAFNKSKKLILYIRPQQFVQRGKEHVVQLLPFVLLFWPYDFFFLDWRKCAKTSEDIWISKMTVLSELSLWINIVRNNCLLLQKFTLLHFFLVFNKKCCDRAKDNGFELRKGRFRLVMRKKFFMMQVIRHWNRLSR